MKLNIKIVEDDKDDLNSFLSLLNSYPMPYEKKIVSYQNASSILSADSPTDIYFLDFELPDINGLETAKVLQKNNPDSIFIFVSQNEDMVFDVQVIHTFYFIRKSNLEIDFDRAMEKLKPILQDRKQVYCHKNKNQVIKIPINSIVYFEVFKNTVELHLNDGQKLIERKSLTEIVDELNNSMFVRIHHSIVVNLKEIERIENGSAILKDGNSLPISVRNLPQVIDAYESFEDDF